MIMKMEIKCEKVGGIRTKSLVTELLINPGC